MLITRLTISLIVASICGCAGQPALVYPMVRADGVSVSATEADIRSCSIFVVSNRFDDGAIVPGGLSTSKKINETVNGAMLGAMVGTLGGAIAGDSRAGTRIGAATGALLGLVGASKDNNKRSPGKPPTRSQRKSIAQCLRDRGYTINPA